MQIKTSRGCHVIPTGVENNKCQMRLWTNRSPCAVLVGIHDGTDNGEEGLAAPQTSQMENCHMTRQFHSWASSPKNWKLELKHTRTPIFTWHEEQQRTGGKSPNIHQQVNGHPATLRVIFTICALCICEFTCLLAKSHNHSTRLSHAFTHKHRMVEIWDAWPSWWWTTGRSAFLFQLRLWTGV